jgi:hypothetical protein
VSGPGASIPPALTIAQADQYLRRFEEQADLLRYQVGGWAAWPLLRFKQNMNLLQLPWASQGMPNPLTMKERALRLPGLITALAGLEERPLLVSVNSTARAEEVSGLYKDIFFDDLLRGRNDFYKLEEVNNKAYLTRSRKALVPSHLYAAPFQVMGPLLGRLLPGKTRRAASALAAALRAEFGPLALPDLTIRRVFSRFYGQKILYSLLFKRLGTRALLLIDAYNSHALAAAARENGVRVVEFQHGVVYQNHPGYSWTGYARRYKDQMPLPDTLLLFGDHWKQELLRGGFWDPEQLVVTGSPRLEDYRSRHAAERDRNLLHLVVTTQNFATPGLVGFLGEFLRLAGPVLPLRLTVKLHPREQDKSPYLSELGRFENVQILAGSESPSTFDLLQQADFHASICSTCHYEALGLGTPTVILPLESAERVHHLLESGCAFAPASPQAMLDILLAERGRRVPFETTAHFFQANALNNLKNFLVSVLPGEARDLP